MSLASISPQGSQILVSLLSISLFLFLCKIMTLDEAKDTRNKTMGSTSTQTANLFGKSLPVSLEQCTAWKSSLGGFEGFPLENVTASLRIGINWQRREKQTLS